MRRWLSFAALFAAFALAARFGWWTTPLVAGLWGALRPRVNSPAGTAALAALVAWGLWLLIDWWGGHGALGRLADRLGGLMNLPPAALILMTLLLPAVLAWSAAALAGALATPLAPRSGGSR